MDNRQRRQRLGGQWRRVGEERSSVERCRRVACKDGRMEDRRRKGERLRIAVDVQVVSNSEEKNGKGTDGCGSRRMG